LGKEAQVNDNSSGYLNVIFPPEIGIVNKKIIFNFYIDNPTNSRLYFNSVVSAPVYGFLSATEMRIGLTENRGTVQDFYLKIYLI